MQIHGRILLHSVAVVAPIRWLKKIAVCQHGDKIALFGRQQNRFKASVIPVVRGSKFDRQSLTVKRFALGEATFILLQTTVGAVDSRSEPATVETQLQLTADNRKTCNLDSTSHTPPLWPQTNSEQTYPKAKQMKKLQELLDTVDTVDKLKYELQK